MNIAMLHTKIIFGLTVLQMYMGGVRSVPMKGSAYPPLKWTQYGQIVGYNFATNGFKAEVFESVPYAAPPVGKLRFESPQPASKWNGVLNCTNESPVCIQFWSSQSPLLRPQSEDCLYLRVIAPAAAKLNRSPVLLWFHGGSYQVNGAKMFPLGSTVKNIVSHGIVVVYANYRLGPLGYMSMLEADFAGNYGLEDMAMAAEWVNKNIGYFGGDPDNVTVGGESAGAASASLLAVSPRTKHLFSKVVLRSGSAASWWAARSDNTAANSRLVVQWCGCDKTYNAKAIKLCLQNTTALKLQELWQTLLEHDNAYLWDEESKPLNKNHPLLGQMFFTPVVDDYRLNKSMIPVPPEEMIRNGAQMPIMLGITSGELYLYLAALTYGHTVIGHHSDALRLRNKLGYYVLTFHYAQPEQVQRAARIHYDIDAMVAAENMQAFLKTAAQIITEQNFATPAVHEALMYAKANQPVFAYVFNHTNKQLLKAMESYGISSSLGAGHGFDMMFLYESTSVQGQGSNGAPLQLSPADRYVNRLLSDSLSAFVKTGNPNGVTLPFRWPQYSAVECGKALRISSEPELIPFFPDAYRFWYDTIRIVDSLAFVREYNTSASDESNLNCTMLCQSPGDAGWQLSLNSSCSLCACKELMLLAVSTLLMLSMS